MKKLSLVLAALAVTGMMSGTVGAMTRSDLQNIRELVEAGDATALRQYLAANPRVMDGSVIGRQLAEFLSSPPRNTFAGRGIPAGNPIPDFVQATIEAAKSDSSLY